MSRKFSSLGRKKEGIINFIDLNIMIIIIFRTTTEDLVFDTVVYFGLKNGNVYIKKMDTRISLKNFKVCSVNFFP